MIINLRMFLTSCLSKQVQSVVQSLKVLILVARGQSLAFVDEYHCHAGLTKFSEVTRGVIPTVPLSTNQFAFILLEIYPVRRCNSFAGRLNAEATTVESGMADGSKRKQSEGL